MQPCVGSWVFREGSFLDPFVQSPKPQNTHLPSDFVGSVFKGFSRADVSMLAFTDPNRFSAGSLHAHVPPRPTPASEASSNPLAQSVLDWITYKVRVVRYFKHLKVEFNVEDFNSPRSPKHVFRNHPSCIPFA